MTAPRLILLLLLILVAVVIVVVVLRRGSAQRDAHRVEAAHLRSQAETLAASVAGQSAFADQAAERAEVARVEAEERAREAARLEAEAAAHRATLEATQRDYEATMRRADDIDPDVKESAYPPISKSGAGQAADGATQPDAGAHEGGDAADGDHVEGDPSRTRAERRKARDAAEADGAAGWAAPAAASSAPSAGAVGGAAAGASAWADRGDEHGHSEDHSGEESERIASAADFRDDVPAEQTEVYPADEAGSEPDMSDNSSTETTQHPGNDDGLDAGGAAAAASAGGGGAYAATREMHRDDGNGSGASTATTDDTTTTDNTSDGADGSAADGSENAEAADGSHDAATDRADRGDRAEGDAAEMTIIGEPEAYATTEPVLASEQTAPVSPEQVGTDTQGADADGSHDGATGDWAADEGDLLEQNSDRGDRLEAERADLAHEAGDAHPTTASDDAGTTASGDDTGSDPESGSGASASRRISAFEEIRDGGFGVGSAAPLEGGAQPLDHPVQGYRDMTYRAPGDHGYDSAEPDVWFYDEGAAQRSGFRRVDG